MYDPRVVDTFIEVYPDHYHCAGRDCGGARSAPADSPVALELDTPREPIAHAADAAPAELLAFVSLARAFTGEAGVDDVLGWGPHSWPT